MTPFPRGLFVNYGQPIGSCKGACHVKRQIDRPVFVQSLSKGLTLKQKKWLLTLEIWCGAHFLAQDIKKGDRMFVSYLFHIVVVCCGWVTLPLYFYTLNLRTSWLVAISFWKMWIQINYIIYSFKPFILLFITFYEMRTPHFKTVETNKWIFMPPTFGGVKGSGDVDFVPSFLVSVTWLL